MGILDKFRDIVGMTEDDDEEEYIITKESAEDISQPIYAQSSENIRKSKVVNIHATTQLQVVLVKPEHFDNVREIADHLNEKKTVVLNLESTNKETSRRLVDFLCGVAYANGGKIQKIAASTFIITPYNVDMNGGIIDELEKNGVFF